LFCGNSSHNHSCTVAQFLGPGRHPVLFYQEEAFRSNPHYHVVDLATFFEPLHRGLYLLPSSQVTVDFVIRYSPARLRKDESAPITVVALSPPVPFHLLGK
jgi:hypothetical protein